MLEIERIKEKISSLDESEAKSLLLMFYARLDTAINVNGGDEVFGQTVTSPNNRLNGVLWGLRTAQLACCLVVTILAYVGKDARARIAPVM